MRYDFILPSFLLCLSVCYYYYYYYYFCCIAFSDFPWTPPPLSLKVTSIAVTLCGP